MASQDQLNELMRRQMDRRVLLKYAAGTGAAVLLAPVLAACAESAGTASPTATATTPPPSGLLTPAPSAPLASITEPSKANTPWQKYKGSTVSVMIMQGNPSEVALAAMVPDFEALTGIKVNYDPISELQYFDKVKLELSSRSGAYDIVMISPATYWQYYPGGWMEPLDPYIADQNLTDQDWYRYDDIYKSATDTCRWNGRMGGGVGEGPIGGVPLSCESYIVSYRKDLADKAGRPNAPQTWDEMRQFCLDLQEAGGGRSATNYGIVARGIRADIADTAFLNGLHTWGGSDFDSSMKCVINSPVAVKWTDYWVDLMKVAGAPDWGSIQDYDMRARFEDGTAAVVIDGDDFAPAGYENTEVSKVAGKIRYAVCPKGPEGQDPQSDFTTFGLGMNSASKNKEAAWLFLQWASSPYQLRRATLEPHRALNPVRQSVLTDPDVQTLLKQWGEGTYASTLALQLGGIARILYTPEPYMGQVYSIWSGAIQDIYNGKPTQESLDGATAEIDALVRQLG